MTNYDTIILNIFSEADMDIKWWIESVIVPLACAVIGGLFGFLACKAKYKISIKNRDGNVVNESKGTKIG